ncbi:MAG: phosphoribosylamine--glycine ligase [Clostridia bacterium]
MKVLIIGGGGREHAIAVQLKKSNKVTKLYCLPGNAGISEIAECAPISVMDFDGIYAFILQNGGMDMVVVAPDDPLAGGLVDYLTKKGVRAFGPNARAANLEASKSFAKNLMKKYGIPTASYETFDNFDSAVAYVKNKKHPIVLKADGLALGKGVIISESVEQSIETLSDMMQNHMFGAAGASVVIEEFMTGKEVSVLAFTDGKTIKPMVSSQDHKRAYDNDKGLNTGGMGTFSPSKAFTPEICAEFEKNIMYPTLKALQNEGIEFKGVIYFGIMLTPSGVKVVEYNARFGDPETQVVLPRLKTDIYDIFNAVIDKTLDKINIEWYDNCAVCVIIASGGYPIKYEKGLEIKIGNIENVTLYHAGTKIVDGKLLSSGGRVIGVTAVADSIDNARKIAYKAVDNIDFNGKQFRTDIGIKL